MKHTPFYASIEAYIRENPEAAAHVADFVQAGLTQALDEARSRLRRACVAGQLEG